MLTPDGFHLEPAETCICHTDPHPTHELPALFHFSRQRVRRGEERSAKLVTNCGQVLMLAVTWPILQLDHDPRRALEHLAHRYALCEACGSQADWAAAIAVMHAERLERNRQNALRLELRKAEAEAQAHWDECWAGVTQMVEEAVAEMATYEVAVFLRPRREPLQSDATTLTFYTLGGLRAALRSESDDGHYYY